MKPEQFWAENLTPGQETIQAQLLCAGCPVISECAGNVLERIDVGEWVDGLWVRETRQQKAVGGRDSVGGRVGVGSGVDVVPHSGVVRAGVVMVWDGTD